MSRMAKEINKVTGTIISVASRLIIYAVLLLLFVEGITKGYAFGYEVFHPTPVQAAPGLDWSVTLKEDQSDWENLRMLERTKMIRSAPIAYIQMKFYDYQLNPGNYIINTSMTSKEILQMINENTQKESEETAGVQSSFEETKPSEEAGTPEEESSSETPEVIIQINSRIPVDSYEDRGAGI